MLHKKPSFYLAIAGIVGMVALVTKSRQHPPAPPPLVEPSRSPYASAVAATGIIEAARENVKISVPKGGLVQKVFVSVGGKVKAGDPLLQLDNREARARLETMKAQLLSLEAALTTDETAVADMRDQFDRVLKLERGNVASEDERKRKEFNLKSAETRLSRVKADIESAHKQVEQAATELEVLTIRAPRDGSILQLNIREGEFAGTQTNEGLMVLGDVDKLQVRADVDEQNAHLVSPGRPATAFLKGSTKNSISLRFVRIEPFVVPKKSLTGDSTERVDTRVLQVIFEFDPPPFPLYVGQQVDVFIDRPANASAK